MNQSDIPTMTDQDKTELDKHLTTDKMPEAVQSMRSGKTSGPDGIPIEVYKLFPDKLKKKGGPITPYPECAVTRK